MSIIDDCVQFLQDLIVGDFNEQQQVSAQLIGGVISLVPIVDQVMDVRDVSGTLYRINKQGGFAKATLEQKIDFGFAAFGVVPEIGSAFKTVFKPLYKQRKAAQGVMNSGVAMVERMLGMRKGGAVKWVKALDWAGNTRMAIDQANLALETCIGLLDYLAQDHWWCPDALSQSARDARPGLTALRGTLAAPVREAAQYMHAFVEDMLGEHAAAVALALAGNTGSMRRTPTPTRARTKSHAYVSSEPRVNGKKTVGTAVRSVESMAYDSYKALDFLQKGLLGEHIVEHHVIDQKGWGLEWNRHDMHGGQPGKAHGWQSAPRKLNDNGIPLYLCTPSATVARPGIDSLWLTNRQAPHQFAVVEAEASMNPGARLLDLLGEASDHYRSKPKANKKGTQLRGNEPKQLPNTRSMALQMSHGWINKLLRSDFAQFSRLILPGGEI